jgi:hypothetical protein
MSICKWIRNDETQCVNKSIENKNYCRLHKKFEELYDPKILHMLKRCKRCKQICDTLNKLNKCDKCVLHQQNSIKKRTQGKQKCSWINQKGEPCPFNSIGETKFCKHHNKYNGQNLNKSIKCSTCKNMFQPESNEKICISCKNTAKKNREKAKMNKKYCKAIIRSSGNPCKNKQSIENEYCKKHQNYKKVIDIEKEGKRVCSNHVRGCFNILTEEDKSKCSTCRFLTNNTKYSTTKTLYDELYNRYKSEANRRNIKWDLNNEETIQLFKENCYYCNYFNGFNGIDRIDSNKHYEITNVVACCKYCNIIKGTHNLINLKHILTHLYNTLILNSDIDYKYTKFFSTSKKQISYNTYKKTSENRGISFQLENDEFYNIIKSPCSYCKLFIKDGCRGIDRIDSNLGYQSNNVVPCCKTCNKMKNILSVECFKSKIICMYKTLIQNIKVDYIDPKTKILNMISLHNLKICEYSPLRMYKDHDYYINKISIGNPVNIFNMKLELEFIDSKTDKLKYSIWQYYRRYISSFKKKKNSSLVGRQIYILVKDGNTETYLGIISLSSDLKYLKNRDNYIGWNSKEYLTNNKINCIMNISTCVSTQPFGYNFNGGKLLTSLVFSKEVLQHIRDKYDIYIQGFTTMSLYGKSIQYDRLKCLKFVGYTHGSSLTNIPNDVIQYCKEYLKKENINCPNDNLWCITKAFKRLKIPVEDFLKSNHKGIYFGYTHKDSKPFLQGKTFIEPNSVDSADNISEIYTWWLNRWAKNRYNHLYEHNRLKKYDDCVRVIKEQI